MFQNKPKPKKRKPKATIKRIPNADRILSVDPGKKAGFAVYQGGKLQESGALDGDDVFEIWGLVSRVEPDAIVLEDQFVGTNPATAKVVVLRRGHWETIAALRMIPTTSIHPSTWLSWAHVKRGDRAGYTRLATSFVGRETSEDESAAILLGLCYWSKAVE